MMPQTQAQGLEHAQERLGDSQRRVLNYIAAHGNVTRNELDQDLGAGQPNFSGSRRLAELEAKGLIHRREPRVCTVSGHRAATWWPGPALIPATPKLPPRRVVLEEAFAALEKEFSRSRHFPLTFVDRAASIIASVQSDATRRSA